MFNFVSNKLWFMRTRGCTSANMLDCEQQVMSVLRGKYLNGWHLEDYVFAQARLTWGVECKQYNTTIIAETGRVEKEPAVRVKLAWARLPNYMTKYARRYCQKKDIVLYHQLWISNSRNWYNKLLISFLYILSFLFRVSSWFTRVAEDNGMNRTKVVNDPRQIKLTVAVANETSLNVTLKTPKVQQHNMFLFMHHICIACVLQR